MTTTRSAPARSSARVGDQTASSPAARIPISLGVLGLVLLVLAPSAAGLYLGLATAYRNTVKLFHDRAADLEIDVVRHVRERLDPVRHQAAFLAELVATGEDDPAERSRFAERLLSALTILPQVTEIAFIDRDARLARVKRGDRRVMRWDGSDDPRTRDLLAQGAGRRAAYWERFSGADPSERTYASLVTPVWRDDRFLGVLTSAVSITELSEFLQKFESSGPQTGFVLINRGNVVAGAGLVDRSGGPSDARALARIDRLDDPVLDAAFPELSESGSVAAEAEPADRIVRVAGRRYTVHYRFLASYGYGPWIVGAYLPLSAIDGEIRRIYLVAGLGGSLVLAALVIAYILGKSLTRPILDLAAAARTLNALDDDPPRLRISRFRELGEAATAFNALASGMHWFKAYLPKSLVIRLMQHGDLDGLASDEREVTVMFTDITDFSALAADRPAGEVADMLNAHFSVLSRCIDGELGTVDKFMGDGMMAFWGAPEEQPDHAKRAVRAALAIAVAMKRTNADRADAGLPSIRLRMGLHTGPAIVGNIGAPDRINYTVVGETVNLAQRIENLASEFLDDQSDAVIMVSKATIDAMGGGARYVSVGSHVLRGSAAAMEIFRLTVGEFSSPVVEVEEGKKAPARLDASPA